MRRRINWKEGDSSPISGRIVAAVTGSGTYYVNLGFPVSAAQVAFAVSYPSTGVPASDPAIYVSGMDDTGFTVSYVNIPITPEDLEFNYLAM